jgi:hypothetical protein
LNVVGDTRSVTVWWAGWVETFEKDDVLRRQLSERAVGKCFDCPRDMSFGNELLGLLTFRKKPFGVIVEVAARLMSSQSASGELASSQGS